MANHMFDAIRAGAGTGERPFIETLDGRRWSYGDMLEISGRLARRLVERGVEPGDRVAVQVEKSAEALMLYLACGPARSTCRSTPPTRWPNSIISSATPSRGCSSFLRRVLSRRARSPTGTGRGSRRSTRPAAEA